MKEQLISFETAKLAKEKGFKIPTPVMYKGNEKSYGHNNEWGIDEQRLDGKFPYTNQQWYSIPTQSFLQTWLREKYNIDISIIKEVNKYLFVSYNILISESCNSKYKDLINLDVNYNTYEEALEVALQEALNLIDSDLVIDNEG